MRLRNSADLKRSHLVTTTEDECLPTKYHILALAGRNKYERGPKVLKTDKYRREFIAETAPRDRRDRNIYVLSLTQALLLLGNIAAGFIFGLVCFAQNERS